MHFNKNQNIGDAYLFFNSIPSTHSYAMELLSHGFQQHGTVISADFQEAGKGQQEKSWFSDKGKNILLSIILFPDNLTPSKLYLMNMAVSLAVRKSILNIYLLPENVFLKWPNDIYILNKKIAGILIKNSLNFHKVQSTIISVGLNVNQASFPDFLPSATSLFINTSIETNRKEMEKNLFAALEEYLTYVNEQPDLLKLQYHSCLLGMNKEHTFLIKKSNEILKGTIIGVSDKGELIVKSSSDDQSLYFQHGDLIYL